MLHLILRLYAGWLDTILLCFFVFGSVSYYDYYYYYYHHYYYSSFECFCILDLEHLTTSQLSSRALAIIKEQAAIDSICFPETMNKMLIVNAPSFFAATWRLIKGWLDPRTAAKIEVISSKSAGEKRLLELVDEHQLPSDYGGKGPDTNSIIMESFDGDASKLDTKMMHVRYVAL